MREDQTVSLKVWKEVIMENQKEYQPPKRNVSVNITNHKRVFIDPNKSPDEGNEIDIKDLKRIKIAADHKG